MIMHRADPTPVIRALPSAAPYIRLYKGKTFIVKAGGGVFGDPAATRHGPHQPHVPVGEHAGR